MQDPMSRFMDYLKTQQQWLEQMDMKGFQQNLKNFYDPATMQHFLQSMGSQPGLHGMNSLFDPERMHDQLMELLDPEQFRALTAYLPNMPDNPQMHDLMEQLAELASSNTKSMTDAIILQSVKLREGIESAIDQAEKLSESHDLDEVMEAQQACWASTRQALAEHFWMNAGLLASAIEANTHFLKTLGQLAEKK